MKNLFLAAFNAELSRRGITHADISERLCISVSTIGRWLRKGTDIKNYESIAVVFGITLTKIEFK